MKAERETQRTKFAETNGNTTILGNRGDGVPPGFLVLCGSQWKVDLFVFGFFGWYLFNLFEAWGPISERLVSCRSLFKCPFPCFSVSESLQDKDSSFVAAWDFGEKGGANDSTDSFPPRFSDVFSNLRKL